MNTSILWLIETDSILKQFLYWNLCETYWFINIAAALCCNKITYVSSNNRTGWHDEDVVLKNVGRSCNIILPLIWSR